MPNKKYLFWLFGLGWVFVSLGLTFLPEPSFVLPFSNHGPEFQKTWHVLGFDPFGRDLVQMIIRAVSFSFWISLGLSLSSLVLAMFFAFLTLKGPIWWQELISGILQLFLALPSLLIALFLAATFGPSWKTLLTALLAGSVPSLTWFFRSRLKTLVTGSQAEAIAALGIGSLRAFRTYFARELWGLAKVKVPVVFCSMMINEATLSYLGVGVAHGSTTLGTLIAQAKDYLFELPHLSISVSLVFFVLTYFVLHQFSESSDLS